MAIADRNLKVGTRLVAQYKQQRYVCEVVQTDEGVRYRLEDGRSFKSPSAAASAVMGGLAANGWRVWSVDGEREQGDRPPKPSRGSRILKRAINQQGAPEGQKRWFCAACGDSFYALTGETPAACPNGHRAELDANGDLVTEAVNQAAPHEEEQTAV